MLGGTIYFCWCRFNVIKQTIFLFFFLAVTEYFENMHRSQGAAPVHGWLLHVRKDGSLTPRFPLLERRYVFGRYAGWRAGELCGWDVCRTG